MIEHIVVLSRHLPDHTKSSGELRFTQILRHLQRRARAMTVFCEFDANRHLFPDLPIYPASELAERRPEGVDLAFLEFWYMDVYMPTLRKWGVPVIVDSVDIEFVRRIREKEVLGVTGNYYHLEKAREIDAYRAADQVWAVSADDADHIHNLNRNIVVVPNIFDPVQTTVAFPERSGVCFVGSYDHDPNVDGMRWYREEIFPLVGDFPHTIIGANAPEDIQAMPGFVGGVESSVDYVSRARVSIAPLRYGAGLKGKVLEAAACGTPVVATSIAGEGYGSAKGLIVADDPRDFADAIRKVSSDEGLWNELSRQGREFSARYSPAAVGPIIDAAMDGIQSDRSNRAVLR